MKILKKYLEYFYTFFFSLLIILLLYLCLGIKWNDKSLLFSDALGQYYPLFIFLKNLSLYTFKIGGGMGTIVTIAYYLISPVNIFIFLINNLQDAIGVIIAVKLALSSLTMYTYLNKTYPKENKHFKFLFSISYMLCSFATKYYFSFIWFDVFYMLPLVILGIDNIVNKKSSFLYIISLFVSLLCNYYMAYMVCIFSIMYFVYKISLIKSKNRKLLIKRFVIGSLLAGLLTSFILYPTFLSSEYFSRADLSTLKIGFNNLSTLKGLFFGNNDYSLQSFTCAYLYTGLFNVILIIEFFLNNKFSRKEKLFTGIMLIILIFSIIFKPLYYMWHVFSVPIGLFARFVFIIDFFIIIIAYKSFVNLKEVNYKQTIIILFILIFLFYLANGNILLTLANLLILLLYLLLIYLSKFSKKYMYIIFFLCMLELIGSAYLSLMYPVEKGTRYSTINDYKYYKVNDLGFYRIGQSISIVYLNGIMSNANDTQFYLSTNQNSLQSFIKKSNFGYSTNYYTYNDSNTEFIDALFSNKYILDKNNYSNYAEIGKYNMIRENGSSIELLELKNDNTFGIATLSNNSLLNKNNDDGLEYQNELFKNMTGLDGNIYEQINREEDEYNYNASYYIVISSTKFSYDDLNIKLYYDNQYINTCTLNKSHPKVIKHLNSIDKLTYYIDGDNNYGISVKFYKFNESLFDRGINILKKNAMTNVIYYDGYLKGNVNVNNNNILFTSIPYENGWAAYVDGKETDVIKVSDGFIGIKLNNGEHTVEFKYETPGIKTGIIISIISFICLIYLIRKEKI